MAGQTADFFQILRTLVEHNVQFVVVGGVCAVLHGAPVSTFDLDIVHSTLPENVSRVMAALDCLHAVSRFDNDVPNVSLCEG